MRHNGVWRRLRAVPIAATAWAAAGWATTHADAAGALAAALWAAGAVGITALGVHGRRRSGRSARRVAGVVVVGAVCAAAAAASVVWWSEPPRNHARSLIAEGGRAVTIEAVLTGKPARWGVDRVAWDAVTVTLTRGTEQHVLAVPVTVVAAVADTGTDADADAPRPDVGARIRVTGTARLGDAGDRAVLLVQSAEEVTVLRPPSGLLAVTAALRTALVSATAGLPQPGAGLIPGLAVGDTSAVDPALDTAMKASSLSHLTAVSGANCALVVGLAFAAVSACGPRRGIRVGAGIAALAGFVLLVTPEPSVVRAAVMALIAMLALLLGRAHAGMAILSLAVTTILIADPWLAGSLGFALSTAATGALLLWTRPLARGLGRVMPRALALAIAVPLSAQLACGPLLVLIAPSVPLYGVVANLLAAPAAPVATIVGLAACLAAPIPVLQAGLTALAWLPAAWIAVTATTTAALPAGQLPWMPGWSGVALLAGLGACVGLVVAGRPRHAPRWRRHVSTAAAGVVAVTAGVVAGTAALAGPVGGWTLPTAWSVLACDVGQGDAVLLRSGGQVALVDTGPEPAPLDVCLSRAGIDRIDLLVLTHFDLDHAGGARSLIGRVGTLLHGLTDGAADERLVADLRAGGAEVVQASAGMEGRLGDAVWRVLWPRMHSRGFPPGNESSITMDIRGGGIPPAILLADLSAAAQQALRATETLRPPYAVVKVAHHGSADQDPALYRKLGGSLALISVGVGNDYGHPRASTLGLLTDLGMSIGRTDLDGLVAVTEAGAGLRVWREKGHPSGLGPGATTRRQAQRTG